MTAKIAGSLLALTLLGFFWTPGHTYLQSDTQIYLPIFEKLENSNLYNRDFMLSTAHVGLTIYDETAIALRRLTHTSFQSVLAAEQIVFRFLGLYGVFLIATALGLGDLEALLLATCYGLGATIVGPAVLSVEYEPVPRGFAVSFLLLAVGLLMHNRYTWACAVASVGFLYHSPATIPFWILFAIIVIRQRQWKAWTPLAVAAIMLAITFASQRNHIRPQPFFMIIDPAWEQVIRMRTAYDWIGQWPRGSVIVFVLYCAAALGALWRIRERLTETQRVLMAGFPLIGVASIAVSWLLLDVWKWAIIAQMQPARAALFTIVFAQINCGIAGLYFARDRRWLEAAAWLVPVFLPPIMPQVMEGTLMQAAGAVLLIAIAVGMLAKARWLAIPALALAGCWAVPNLAHTINYPSLHTPELDQLSEWARTQTSDQALFVFPLSGRNLEQGVFRVKSLRSLYADWKAGGQVNYFRDFALEWHRRWLELSSGKLTANDWSARGVEYLIYGGSTSDPPLGLPVFENARYRVYAIRNAP